MTTTEKYQGDDITLSITVGTDVNIEDLAELFVYIINKKTLEVLIKFNKEGSTGFTALDKITTMIYEAIIPSGTTKTAETGYYNIEGNAVNADDDYEDSEENAITLDDRILLKSSVSKASSSG
ncbi:hypothetical protein ES705_33016 [subsurface metagenome]